MRHLLIMARAGRSSIAHRANAVAAAIRSARLLWLCAALWVLACSPASGRDEVVVFASGADLESANPLTTVHPLARQVQRFALFVTLARYDERLQPAPYLARSWEFSADRRTLTLHLFNGLSWHDGERTTARDVAFTINAARDPETGSPRAVELSTIDQVSATDDSTVVLRFSVPPATFPAVFCELPIAPAHLLAKLPRRDLRRAEFNTAPVGNGPFRFASRAPGRQWVFERDSTFPDALGGAPHLRRLVITVVDEPTTKFAGLVSGDLDVAGISPTMASLVDADPALRLVTYPVPFSVLAAFNTTRPPLDDPRVRMALSLLIDRERVVRVALAGFATPATGLIPFGHPYHAGSSERTHVAPDTLRADSLLDAAGWRRQPDGWRVRNGERLALELIAVASGDNAVEQLVQADWRGRGIDASVRLLELGAFLTLARASQKDFSVLITGVPGDLALSHVTAMFDGSIAGGPLDYTGYHTPRLDTLFDRTRRVTTTPELVATWRDIERELVLASPVAWIYHARGVQGVTRRLQGVTMDLRGELVTLLDWRFHSTNAAQGRASP